MNLRIHSPYPHTCIPRQDFASPELNVHRTLPMPSSSTHGSSSHHPERSTILLTDHQHPVEPEWLPRPEMKTDCDVSEEKMPVWVSEFILGSRTPKSAEYQSKTDDSCSEHVLLSLLHNQHPRVETKRMFHVWVRRHDADLDTFQSWLISCVFRFFSCENRQITPVQLKTLLWNSNLQSNCYWPYLRRFSSHPIESSFLQHVWSTSSVEETYFGRCQVYLVCHS